MINDLLKEVGRRESMTIHNTAHMEMLDGDKSRRYQHFEMNSCFFRLDCFLGGSLLCSYSCCGGHSMMERLVERIYSGFKESMEGN